MRTSDLLDMLLTMSGNRLNSRLLDIPKLGTLVNNIFRVLLMISTAAQACLVMQEIKKMPRITPYAMTAVVMVCVSALAVIVFAIRRRAIARLVHILSEAQPDSRYQYNMCLMGLLLSYAFFVTGILSWFQYLPFLDGHPMLVILLTLLMIPTEVNQFFVIYCVAYIVILDMMTQYERRSLDDMRKRAATGHSAVSLIHDRKQVMKLKRTFEQLFNVVPLTTLAIPFVTIPGIVSRFSSSDSGIGKQGPVDAGEAAFLMTVHAALAAFLVMIVECASRPRHSVNSRISEVIFSIQEHNCSADRQQHLLLSGYQSLIDELRIDQEFFFSGWHMFDVDRHVYLVFMSALISTTVLVIEIEKNAKQS